VFSIVITEKGGAQRQLDIESPEVSIGRLEDNDICLPKSNVSKHHARLVFKDDRYVLLDQKSTNGTYVNGRRISAPMVVRKGDKIYIGDFILTLAAPGGTFEGVSAREFRPRRPVSEPIARDVASTATDPPKGMAPTRDELQRPAGISDVEFADAIGAGLESSGSAGAAGSAGAFGEPDSGGNSKPPSGSGASPSLPPTAAARVAAAPQSRATAPGIQPQIGVSLTPRTVSSPPPLPASVARVTVPPPPRAARAKIGESRPVAIRAETTRIDDIAKHLEEIETQAGEPAERPAAPSGGASGNPNSGATRGAAAKDVPRWSSQDSSPLQSGLTSPAVLAPSLRLQGALAMLMERLATEMNVARPEESAFPSEHLATIEHLIDELASEGSIGPDLDRRYLREAAVSEAVGLGPLDRLLSNRSVREVVVDGPTRILADLGGGLSPVSSFFSDDSAVMVVARRLLHRAGRKFDDSIAVQEARLPSGGFLQLLLPPLSSKGPLVTVRCPPRAQSSPESQVTEGVLSTDMLAFLRSAVQQRKNILVLGAMGSGVSTMLGVLTMLAPDHERVVTIENAPSGSLLNAQTLPLSRDARPDLSLHEFLRYASRLRHDRLVIDDVSGTDALAALTAAAANPGVIFGMHAPTPQTALLQLELFAQAAVGGGKTSLQPLLASALNVLVHIASTAEGTRRVMSITEVKTGVSGLELRGVFRLDGKTFVKG
jgi:pilus assembly protein CpaF